MTKDIRKYGSNTDRKAGGKFGPGNPGKPKGARHQTTRAVETLMNGEAETITRTMINAAVDGDIQAAKFILERIGPAPRKDAPVLFALPEMVSAGDALTAVSHIVRAVANGELTPNEATSMAGLVETFRRTAETEELERRVARLEEKK